MTELRRGIRSIEKLDQLGAVDEFRGCDHLVAHVTNSNSLEIVAVKHC